MGKKLLYDIEQILNSAGRGTGLCRVSDLLFKELIKCSEYEIYPIVTKNTKYKAQQYLAQNGLDYLFQNIVYLPDLRTTCVTASILKRIKSWLFRILREKQYLKILNSYDEYISPYSPISPLVYKSKLKTTIIVHDLISIAHPELCTKKNNKKYEFWIKDIKADNVVCISHSTLNDFVKFRPDFDKHKIKVVYWGIENRFKPTNNSTIRTKYGIKTTNYILTLSEVNKRKNLLHLLKAFAEFLNNSKDKDISLVIAGPKKKNYDEVTSKIEQLQKIKDKVVITGFVNDEDLPSLYSEAELFVFPSLYEGFGLPPLEAIACGTPVICTDNSSLPEVCGDAVIYISGHDIYDTAQKIADLHNNPNKRKEMSLAGLKQAQKFNWSKTTKEIFNLGGKYNDKKIKVLFDATIIANAITKNSSRSGIFCVTYQVARRLAQNPSIDLQFYCTEGEKHNLRQAINKELFEFKNITIYKQEKNFIQRSLDFFKNAKKEAKQENLYIWAFLFHFIRLIYSIIYYLFDRKKQNNITDVDIFLSPMSYFPKHFLSDDIRKYIILHDVIPLKFPEYYPDIKIGQHWLLKVIQQFKMSNNIHAFANSEHTKKDFLQYIPELKSEQITVTPLACADSFKPCSKEDTIKSLKKYGLPTDKKYVFSLCSLEPRKNLVRAVKTFIEFIKKNNIDDIVFILGGGHWKEFIGKLDQEINNLGNYKDKIIKAGYIDDEDLAPLYSGAQWFVYTSQYEGFGLPPLEAMACGCPVISSNNSSLPEVVGNAGIMVDYDSDEQHIKAYENYYFNTELCAQMRLKGLERAKQFSWDKTVKLMVEEMMK